MEVTDQDVDNVRRISEDVFGNTEYVQITNVKDTDGSVMVRVEATDSKKTLGTRNAFAGANLHEYHANGYVAIAVGGGEKSHSAWFERADSIEFGSSDPEGDFDLKDDWNATVGDNLVVRKDGDVVAHIERDGWYLDPYPLYYVLPSHVGNHLEEHGFEPTDDLRRDE